MKDLIKRYHKELEWILAGVVIVTALAAWLTTTDLTNGITIYDVFPPLGLIAFGLMWTHFIMGAIRRYGGVASKGSVYASVSFGLVLGLIILHPLLLWIGLYQDGYGLPPASHVTAYQSQLLAVGLGTISLTIFLAFELRKWFSKKPWWRVVELAQIIGMAAIFYHALELGGELHVDWFMALWWFYGVTLTISIVYNEIIYKVKGNKYGKTVKQ